MKCYCKRPLIMSKSQLESNPGRLFLKCPKQGCDFFQWVDKEPWGKTKAWMEEGRFRGIREGYPRPRDLLKHLQKRNREAEGRNSRKRRKRKEKDGRIYRKGPTVFSKTEKWHPWTMGTRTRASGRIKEEWRTGQWQHGKATVGIRVRHYLIERNWIWDE